VLRVNYPSTLLSNISAIIQSSTNQWWAVTSFIPPPTTEACQYENVAPSASSPDINQLAQEDDSGDNVQELLKKEHTLCVALEDYDNRSDPQKLTLKVCMCVCVTLCV